jgi:TIR domain-containing protein
MPETTVELLRCLVPLKVVIVWERPGSEQVAIGAAIRRAFQGGQSSIDSAEAYLAVGEDLGVNVLEVDFSNGEADAVKTLSSAFESALHTIIVAVIHDVPSDAFKSWLDQTDDEVQNPVGSQNSVALLPVLLREHVWEGNTQGLNYLTLDEWALRPAYAAVNALAVAWRILGSKSDRLSLFISHAKLDGLPLARSFRSLLENLSGLEGFYDAKHIPPGSNWKNVLRSGVERSVVVAFRTNVYEERFWCVQEMDWAEDFGCPIVMVEARTQLVRAREFLPIGGAPCIHVPDGNLMRILQSALREALRVRLFVRQVQALESVGAIAVGSSLRVPRTSLATLGLRCEWLINKPGIATHVFVPEKFREPHRKVAARLARCYFADAWLGTPETLIQELIAAAP